MRRPHECEIDDTESTGIALIALPRATNDRYGKLTAGGEEEAGPLRDASLDKARVNRASYRSRIVEDGRSPHSAKVSGSILTGAFEKRCMSAD